MDRSAERCPECIFPGKFDLVVSQRRIRYPICNSDRVVSTLGSISPAIPRLQPDCCGISLHCNRGGIPVQTSCARWNMRNSTPVNPPCYQLA